VAEATWGLASKTSRPKLAHITDGTELSGKRGEEQISSIGRYLPVVARSVKGSIQNSRWKRGGIEREEEKNESRKSSVSRSQIAKCHVWVHKSSEVGKKSKDVIGGGTEVEGSGQNRVRKEARRRSKGGRTGKRTLSSRLGGAQAGSQKNVPHGVRPGSKKKHTQSCEEG